MTINNYDELILFIESNDLTSEQIAELIKNCLNVYTIHFENSDIIEELKEYWNKFGHLPRSERPLFLFQTKRNIQLKDILKVPELKKIVEKIESYY